MRGQFGGLLHKRKDGATGAGPESSERLRCRSLKVEQERQLRAAAPNYWTVDS
jgi:hypothetical protein